MDNSEAHYPEIYTLQKCSFILNIKFKSVQLLEEQYDKFSIITRPFSRLTIVLPGTVMK
jgi:hypothetical protein